MMKIRIINSKSKETVITIMATKISLALDANAPLW